MRSARPATRSGFRSVEGGEGNHWPRLCFSIRNSVADVWCVSIADGMRHYNTGRVSQRENLEAHDSLFPPLVVGQRLRCSNLAMAGRNVEKHARLLQVRIAHGFPLDTTCGHLQSDFLANRPGPSNTSFQKNLISMVGCRDQRSER